MLKTNIKYILKDIHAYDGYTKAKLFQECIRNKLKATIIRYDEEIEDSTDYLLTRSSAKVLKAITKIQKADDKNRLEAEALEKEFEEDLEKKENYDE